MSSDQPVNTALTEKYQPVDTEGNPILWSSGNPAHLEGIMYEVRRFFRRKGTQRNSNATRSEF